MITCPECGAQNGADVKFCERCGQGLAGAAAGPAPIAALPPLAAGAELKGGLRIVELIGKTSNENRYRAERHAAGGGVERFQLREQVGPAPGEAARSANDPGPADGPGSGAPAEAPGPEDPNGPRAKTAELKLKPRAAERAPGESRDHVHSGGLATATAESSAATDSKAVESRAMAEPTAAKNGLAKALAPTSGAVTLTETIAAEAVAGEPLAPAHASGAASAATAGGEAEVGESAVEDEVAGASAAASAITAEAANKVPADAEVAAVSSVAAGGAAQASSDSGPAPAELSDDLGEVFGRVMALSLTLNHPALQRAVEGFAANGRVYLAYPDEQPTPLSRRKGGLRMSEADAIAVAIQVCQAVSFVNRRGLRFNDICPESVAVSGGGRIKLTGLDYVANDTELQAEPIFNDGYTAPEIYRARKVDKRADVFSVGALLYTCLTGERLESETWRGEAGPIRFYPPHVVSPALEQAVRRALLFDPAARWPNVDALKAELLRLAGIIRVRAAVLTDVGMVRELNEDSILAVEYQRDSLIEPAQNFLYVVADGMGGAAAGEMASAIAVGTIRDYVGGQLKGGKAGENQPPPGQNQQLLKDALEEANRKILEYQAANIDSRGMGSTAVGVLIVPPEAIVAWVGDSRAYFYDQGGLRQLTKDHSLVQRLIEIGQITAEEARHHEHKNVITRSLGARPNGLAGAEAVGLRLKRGDRIMVCSDGLTAHVDDPEIGAILQRQADPYEAARELVVAANAGGGTDNVSVVVILID